MKNFTALAATITETLSNHSLLYITCLFGEFDADAGHLLAIKDEGQGI